MLLFDLWSLLLDLWPDQDPLTAEPKSGPVVEPHG